MLSVLTFFMILLVSIIALLPIVFLMAIIKESEKWTKGDYITFGTIFVVTLSVGLFLVIEITQRISELP
mgnify:CR=1 FL=1|jgi:uncharacterized membrane protein YedE/YeeE